MLTEGGGGELPGSSLVPHPPLAPQNQLFLRKYNRLHHKTNYSLGNTSFRITNLIIHKEIQAVASQNQLFLRKYNEFHQKVIKTKGKPVLSIKNLIIPKEIKAFASQNPLFLRKYKLLHHKTY